MMQGTPENAYAAGHAQPPIPPVQPCEPQGAPSAYKPPANVSMAAAPVKKGRRVGTLTMALCLIAVGTVMILKAVGLDFSLVFAARFAPAVLILLGTELLVAHVLHREERLRFDGLSVFISLILICGSLLAAAYAEFWRFEFTENRAERRAEAELETDAAAALGKAGVEVYGVEWYVDFSRTSIVYNYESADLADINPEDYVQARVFLPAVYGSPEAFAEECSKIMDTLLGCAPHIDYASFYVGRKENGEYEGDITYALYLDGRFQTQAEAGDMVQWVETRHWVPDERYYMSGWEYEEALQYE